MFPATSPSDAAPFKSAITASSRSRTDAHALLIGIPNAFRTDLSTRVHAARVDDAADARAR